MKKISILYKNYIIYCINIKKSVMQAPFNIIKGVWVDFFTNRFGVFNIYIYIMYLFFKIVSIMIDNNETVKITRITWRKRFYTNDALWMYSEVFSAVFVYLFIRNKTWFPVVSDNRTWGRPWVSPKSISWRFNPLRFQRFG